MKRNLLMLLLCTSAIAYGQSKPDVLSRVKAGVRKYLYLTMKDYKSYQPVQWGKLYTETTQYSDTDEGAEMIFKVKKNLEISQIILEQIEERKAKLGDNWQGDSTILAKSDTIKIHTNEAQLLLNKYKLLDKKYPHRPISYEILHTFRGKNSYGAYTINTYRFVLGAKFEVISAVDPTDEDEE